MLFSELELPLKTPNARLQDQTRRRRLLSCGRDLEEFRPPLEPPPSSYDCKLGATSRATLTSAAISGVIGSRCGITMPME